jgi:outer membrane protein insertion porin family
MFFLKKINHHSLRAWIVLIGFLSLPVFAMDSFVVKDIRIEGIQRTEPGTVFSYLPVRVGDTMDDEKATQAIKALYSTGFFKDVRVESENDVLVVTLQERPAIASISFSGNKSFPTDKMLEGMKQVGLAEGLIFDKSMLNGAEQEIKRQYLSQGKYSATVKATATPLERNRVAVSFDIEEGSVSKIRGIYFVGNTAFTQEELEKQFSLSKPTLMTWWNKNDQYSKQKLTADLETLKSFYTNQGFLEFNISSTQVTISPDRADIYITVNLMEGERYSVKDIKVSGDTIIPEKEIRTKIRLKPGDIFSREKLTGSTKAITDRIGNEGYAFATVNPLPDVDKENHTVSFNFVVDPGKRVYVRRINFTGNERTREDVLRREMRQMESAWYGTDKVERSKQRLERLGYFETTKVETPAVPGTTDQVDVNFEVKERSTGSIMLGAGLSSTEGIVLSLTVSQSNFLGTGNSVVSQISTSKVNTIYSLTYTDPYYTPDGISRSFNVFDRHLDTTSLGTGTYVTNSFGGGVTFGFPVNERDRITAGLGLEHTDMTLQAGSPRQYIDYCNNQLSCTYNSWTLNLGYIHDTRDNIIFPRSGVNQRVTLELALPGLDLEYYKAEYKHSWYTPVVNNNWVLMLNGDVGYAATYGSGPYPFFKNFWVGGVDSVRGYDVSAIGPWIPPATVGSTTSPGYWSGGTKKVVANAELFFPIPGVAENQFRLSAFVDAGDVWAAGESMSLGDIRYSTGLGAAWFSPFGPIKLVFAHAINPKPTDRTQTIQFQMGSTF